MKDLEDFFAMVIFLDEKGYTVSIGKNGNLIIEPKAKL